LAEIRARVAKALQSAGRNGEHVTIVAVSKQQPAERVKAAYHSGQMDFGESYLQEALAKMAALADLPIVWHYIGPVQANKTRAIATHFQWVHSVDRSKIAQRLNEQRPPHAPPLNVLIQVNLASEPQKAGAARAQVADLAATVRSLPRPPARAHGNSARARDHRGSGTVFPRPARPTAGARGRRYRDRHASMGMSGDFEVAIASGSTCVRIGTALFGPRDD
jgi:pyridoxal phosphate enzyme (YggS family)